MSKSDLPVVKLYIKSSPVEPKENGPCPISQKWFMVFYTMVEHELLTLELTAVDIKYPPQDFLDLNVGRYLPVAVVLEGNDPRTGEDISNLIADNDDEIENLMDRFKCPGMELGASAFKVTEDLFRNFNSFLQTSNNTNMVHNLEKLNEFLENRGTKYLQGDEISFVDCVVMPKLQHLRVACAAFKEYNIPAEYNGLWNYFNTMYNTKAFNLSCASDRDILIHYSEKANPKPRTSFHLRDNSVTSNIPEGVTLKE